jgi:hypothetical protein
MLRREKRLLCRYTSVIALLVKRSHERTMVNVDTKLVSDPSEWLKSLLVRDCSVRDQPLVERSIQER